MKKIPRISTAEWEVMKVVWEQSPVSANEIVEQLSHSDWKEKTIKTMLNRLVKKGALSFEKEGRGYLYFATVTEDDCKHAEVESLVNKAFDGSMTPLLVHFVENHKISRKELKELKKILRKKEK